MRVVEMGKIPEREIECEGCKTILAYTDADIHDADHQMYQYVECPICGEKLVIPYAED
jgi:ribosomal protein S27E